MKTAFDPRTGEWKISWPGRVSRHDLVYQTPPSDPLEGLPLGNGEVGALCWCEGSKLIVALNRSDLWDDASFTRFHNWKSEEEDVSTTLRHGCRVILDFGHPIFDLFYLQDFEARLSLANGRMEMALATPFGTAKIDAVVDFQTGVFSAKVATQFTEDVPLVVSLERYGSRTFAHWYIKINRDARIGLSGTEAWVAGSDLGLTHQLTSGPFHARCRVSGPLQIDRSKISAHRADATIRGSGEKHFSIRLVLTEPGGSLDEAAARLDEAESQAEQESAAHDEAWKSFWMQSYVETGDDYLDNLWHLTMYYAAASQRGNYPGNFIHGLWAWNRDVKNWNFYFHWNQQQIYWPLNAAGHHDLCESYLAYRFRSLPHAKQDARDVFQCEGAIVSDVAERRGYNSVHEFKNHTPVAQIAMDFWRQYEFTGDRTFLIEQALPYLQEAAAFFETLFERGPDGKYHARSGTGYEGWILLRDVVSELVSARVLFAAVTAALSEAGVSDARAGRWAEIGENLADLPVNSGKEAGYLDQEGCYQIGPFKGEKAFGGNVLAAGLDPETRKPQHSIVPQTRKVVEEPVIADFLRGLEADTLPLPDLVGDARCNDGIFPWVEYSAVFPSGFVGLAQYDEPIFQAARDTARLFAPDGMGWDVLPIVLARLGLRDETWRILREFPGRWQFYPNGWGHYGTRSRATADAALRFRAVRIEEAVPEERRPEAAKFPYGTWPFRHMGMESMSVLAAAINESLLQSHDGVIRVGPAAPPTPTARMTLHARGGFVVSAEWKDGQVQWVGIRSERGGAVRLANPWPVGFVFRAGCPIDRSEGRVIEIATEPGQYLWFSSEEKGFEQLELEELDYPANSVAKSCSRSGAILGIPRMF